MMNDRNKPFPKNGRRTAAMAQAACQAIAVAGGKKRLAALLSEHRIEAIDMYHRIDKWRLNGIPPAWVLAVESATGLHRSQLRPDIYPPESFASVAALESV